MSKTTMNDLRNHLFETIERLKSINDPEASECEKINIEAAKSIADIGQVIVNSAKLEVDAMKYLSGTENPKLVQDAMNRSCVFMLSESAQ